MLPRVPCWRDPSHMKASAVPGIGDVVLFTPTPHADERRFFCRTSDAKVLSASHIDHAAFVQDSISRSSIGVIRELHIHSGRGEAKLVRCSYGQIFDVIVDLRPESLATGGASGLQAHIDR